MHLSSLIKPKILLILICVLFLFTRLYKISEIPPSVYWDEASIGYNAYIISKDGKDEWGDFLPIHFRAFGEFKLPVYIYSVVPFVKIFGLNEFSVRLPAVLFSLGVVILTYFLAKKIIKNEWVGLFAAIFVAISPWFFIFSRTGYEATAGLSFYLLGIYLLLKIRENPWFLFISAIAFILSIYSYNSFRIVTPLTIVLMFFWIPAYAGMTMIRRVGLPLILSILVALISIIPIIRLYTLDSGGLSRLEKVGVESSGNFVRNYFSHFSLDFLLYGDKNPRSQQPNMGQIYFPELIIILFGVLYVISNKLKFGFMTIALLLISPIPAAITKEFPHALRSISAVPFISILASLGILYIRGFLKIRFVEVGILLIFLGIFANYYLNFLNTYPTKSSSDWQYGYKKIFIDFGGEFPKYDRIIISDEYGQPYIIALFYSKYDPEKFQREVVRNSIDKWGFSTVSKFGKFEFGKANELSKSGSGKSLIFASTMEEVSNADKLGTVNFLDGTLAFGVYSK